MRLDAYLAQFWPEYSRSTWQKYIQAGYVLVNGEVETITKRTLDEDDIVTPNIPKATPKDIALKILYEDENVVVIDKPAGILSHSKGALNDEATVADFIRPKTSYNSGTNRPGIIHRLDRDTSGVMILVRNQATAKLLQKQFADRKVKKTYMAIVKGRLKHSKASIELPIERNPKKPSQFRVGSRGKAATTNYEVISTHGNLSLVKLTPETGRTHQLRVHMAHIGAPIVGDKLYGQAADRLYLHALRLEGTIPNGKRRVFSSELPQEFNNLLEAAS